MLSFILLQVLFRSLARRHWKIVQLWRSWSLDLDRCHSHCLTLPWASWWFPLLVIDIQANHDWDLHNISLTFFFLFGISLSWCFTVTTNIFVLKCIFVLLVCLFFTPHFSVHSKFSMQLCCRLTSKKKKKKVYFVMSVIRGILCSVTVSLKPSKESSLYQ